MQAPKPKAKKAPKPPKPKASGWDALLSDEEPEAEASEEEEEEEATFEEQEPEEAQEPMGNGGWEHAGAESAGRDQSFGHQPAEQVS